MKIFTFNNLLRVSLINFFLFLGIFIFFGQKPTISKTQPNIKSQEKALVENSPTESPTPEASSTENLSPSPTAVEVKTETLSERTAKHASKNDCWIIYSNSAYDITSYFGSHPGGDAIMLKYCGKDATAAFDSKDLSPASPHSESASALLSQYLVE